MTKLNLLTGAVIALSILTVSSEGRKFTEFPSAVEKNVIEKLEKRQKQELRCLKSIDDALSSKWSKEVEKIPVGDLGRIKAEFSWKEPSKPIYHTYLQEWLMEKGSPSRKISKCFGQLAEKIKPSLRQRDVECLDKLFLPHIEKENKFSANFVKQLNTSTRDQVPFRRFISFHELTELMFQNRNPDSLTSTERVVYEHSESQLSTEEDKDKKMFLMQQRCAWKNARALQEASTPSKKFKEFESQVRDLFNQMIGQQLIRTSQKVNLTLIQQRHVKWLENRQAMGNRLKQEISKLKTQKRNSQWLCEYASTLAEEFYKKESSLLTQEDGYEPQKSKKVAEETRAIEIVLKKRKDIRHASLNSLAKGVDSDSRCLQGFASLVQQHQLFEAASLFMDSRYTYPELHCNIPALSFETISPVLCNCIGSYCAAHGLAVLIANEYKMIRGNDGVYKVIRIDKRDKNRG